MTQFKFFRGYIGTLDIMDGQTYATASLSEPTNLYWTPEESEEQRTQRMVVQSMEVDNLFRLYQTTRVITVSSTPWTKVKIFGTRVKLVLIETWKLEPIGVVVMTLLVSVVTFIGVMKLFGA
jgi:hypothetical protein